MSTAASQTRVERFRCAIYTRKSTEEGLDQKFNSLDAQREAGEAFITSQRHQGWECLPDRYDDGGFSGSNVERPALQRLMADIDAGKVDAVVVYKVDRLSRSLLDFARLMGVFEHRNVSFVSVTQQFNTSTSMGRLLLNVLLSFAQFEREMIAERTKHKMAAARRKGKWVGGTPPIGYNVEPRTGLVVNDAEADQVREIFRVYLKERSLVATAEILNARGWRTKTWTTKKGRRREGKTWDKGAVHRVLTSVTYIGKVFYEDTVYEGEHEGIVDPRTFAHAREMLSDNAADRGASTRNRRGFILRSLLRCKVCGSGMTTSWARSKSGTYRYYVCTKVNGNGREACTVRSIPANAIEQFVVTQLRDIASDPELIGRIAGQLSRDHAERIPALESERDRLKDDQRRCRDDAGGAIRALSGQGESSRLAAERLAELDQRATDIERRLTEIQEELLDIMDRQLSVVDVRHALAVFDPVWDLLGTGEQARILRLLLKRIDYNGSTGELEMSFYPLGIARLASEVSADDDPTVPIEAAS